MTTKTRLLLVGGPDVDARLPFIATLKGYEVAAAGSDMSLNATFEAVGVDYFYYPLDRRTNPLADLRTFVALFRIFRRWRPTIVHTFDTKPGVWGRLAAKAARVPIVIGTLPGLGHLYVADSLKNRLFRSVYEPLQRLASRKSDLTIFQNSDDLQQFTQQGIVHQNNSVVIAGSGIDTDEFSKSAQELKKLVAKRAALKLDDDQIIFTLIARLLRTKGIDEFANAARALIMEGASARFIVIGYHEPQAADSMSEAEIAALAGPVEFLGKRDDVAELLALSHVFVLPTYYREGVPRVLLEAAAMELPLIATDMPGCREVVVDGENGFLVRPKNVEALANAMRRLYHDPKMRAKFGQASRALVETHFDLKVVSSDTNDRYQRLIKEKRLE